MVKCRACNSNNKWCNNSSWCNKCTNLWAAQLICRMLIFNNNKSCNLRCFSNQLMGSRNNQICNNQTLWICQILRCHKIWDSLKCKLKYHQISFRTRWWEDRTRFSHKSFKTFHFHLWWNYLRWITLLKTRANRNREQRSTIGNCTHQKKKLLAL